MINLKKDTTQAQIIFHKKSVYSEILLFSSVPSENNEHS